MHQKLALLHVGLLMTMAVLASLFFTVHFNQYNVHNSSCDECDGDKISKAYFMGIVRHGIHVLVLLGALAGLTGLVSRDALHEGMRAALPPYRQQHLEENLRALSTGYASVPAGSVPAWEVAA